MQSDEGFGPRVNYAGERGDQRNDVSADRTAQEQMAADVSGGQVFFFLLLLLCLCDTLRESLFFLFFEKQKNKNRIPLPQVRCVVLFCRARRSRPAKFLTPILSDACTLADKSSVNILQEKKKYI